MAIMQSPPRISPFSVAPSAILFVLLISSCTPHAFLPRRQTSWRQKSDASLTCTDDLQPLQMHRGGADAVYIRETTTGTSDAFATVTVLESTATVDASDVHLSVDDDEMAYTTIGVLNVPTSHDKNVIMLSYEERDISDRRLDEMWGMASSRHVGLPGEDCGNDLALAEAFGCLCNGIVLNLPKTMLSSEPDQFSAGGIQKLDDVLLCIAKGILRRIKGSEQIMAIQVSVTFDGEGQIRDSLTEPTERYVQTYLERAIHNLWGRHFGLVADVDSILQQCKVDVSLSPDSASETAQQLANSILEQDSTIRKHNVVPRPLFGALCQKVHTDISNGWQFRGFHNRADTEWKKLDASVLHQQSESEVQPVTSDIKEKVDVVVAAAIADAEEKLAELESKMDEALLEGIEDGISGKEPMPEFKSDADAIMAAVSSYFLQLLEDDKLTASDREWVNIQRIRALKQVAGTGIRRLFRLHLQNLRDLFGQLYEAMLESSITDGFHADDDSQRDVGTWKLRSQKAARQAEEGFRKAAFGSVPQMCQHPDGELRDELAGMFGCVEALGGLLEDMYEVTLARGMEEEEWADIMGGDTEESTGEDLSFAKPRVGLRQVIKNAKAKIQKRGPAKWYERLALKALVIGVNYVQGWIVLQALRREAMKRDRDMPKFPLF